MKKISFFVAALALCGSVFAAPEYSVCVRKTTPARRDHSLRVTTKEKVTRTTSRVLKDAYDAADGIERIHMGGVKVKVSKGACK